MKYFAYGSNLNKSRLARRINPATIISESLACLRGYVLVFNKIGNDESGKANLRHNRGERVLGMCFEMDEEGFDRLRQYEVGYDVNSVQLESVTLGASSTFEAKTFISTQVDDTLKPDPEYLRFILEGARNCGMHASYLEEIEKRADIE